jgi:hypothetical protein
MCKYFLAGLYSVSLLLLLYISGCLEAGSGHMRYGPPKNIVCGKPWVITVDFSLTLADPKEKHGKLAERYKDVVIHIRDSSNSNFITMPMVIENVTPATGDIQFNATMKAIPCDSGITYVEYYIDEMFNCVYNRTKLYRVPVTKD